MVEPSSTMALDRMSPFNTTDHRSGFNPETLGYAIFFVCDTRLWEVSEFRGPLILIAS